MRRVITFLLSIIFVVMMGCGATPVRVDRLQLPDQLSAKKTESLSAKERATKEKELKARVRLLEILTQIEKDIKSKSKRAKFFDFALKDNDRTTLAAAQILLKHIKRSKAEIEAEIVKLHEELN